MIGGELFGFGCADESLGSSIESAGQRLKKKNKGKSEMLRRLSSSLAGRVPRRRQPTYKEGYKESDRLVHLRSDRHILRLVSMSVRMNNCACERPC